MICDIKKNCNVLLFTILGIVAAEALKNTGEAELSAL